MNDAELKSALKNDFERIMAQAAMRQPAAWRNTLSALRGEEPESERVFGFGWAGWVTTFAVVAAAIIYMAPFGGGNASLTMADSHEPGLYASTFYSDKAEADVVWISGMDMATDN